MLTNISQITNTDWANSTFVLLRQVFIRYSIAAWEEFSLCTISGVTLNVDMEGSWYVQDTTRGITVALINYNNAVHVWLRNKQNAAYSGAWIHGQTVAFVN